MSKRILFLISVLVLVCTLCSCECDHQWLDATCTAPQTCSICTETQGEVAAHNWQAAICTTPETCANCGTTKGTPVEHSWTDANCTTPKTCSNCGATSGDPAEHNWTDANCSAPKTCISCGITDGETLPHDYQVVSFHDDTMTSQCQACGDSVNGPIDRSLYFQTLLTGHWDLFAIQTNSKQTSAYNIEEIGPFLNIAKDGTIRLHLENNQIFELTCEYLDYQIIDDHGVYFCYFINSADYSQYPAQISEVENDLQLSIFLPKRTIILQKNILLEQYSTGKWHCFEQDQLYTLELFDDRTFTVNLLGGISGTWHIKPIVEASFSSKYDTYTIVLSFTLGDKPMTVDSSITLSAAGEAMNVLTGKASPRGSFYWYDDITQIYVSFRAPGVYPGEHTVIEQDVSKIVDIWASYEVTKYIFEPYSYSTEKNSNHYAIFNEDGTFMVTASKTITGLWRYICTTTESGYTYYWYTLQTDDQDGYQIIQLWPNGSRLEWSYFENFGNNTGADYRFESTG